MADAEVSKTSDFGRVSSSLTSGTTKIHGGGGFYGELPPLLYVCRAVCRSSHLISKNPGIQTGCLCGPRCSGI